MVRVPKYVSLLVGSIIARNVGVLEHASLLLPAWWFKADHAVNVGGVGASSSGAVSSSRAVGDAVALEYPGPLVGDPKLEVLTILPDPPALLALLKCPLVTRGL